MDIIIKQLHNQYYGQDEDQQHKNGTLQQAIDKLCSKYGVKEFKGYDPSNGYDHILIFNGRWYSIEICYTLEPQSVEYMYTDWRYDMNRNYYDALKECNIKNFKDFCDALDNDEYDYICQEWVLENQSVFVECNELDCKTINDIAGKTHKMHLDNYNKAIKELNQHL